MFDQDADELAAVVVAKRRMSAKARKRAKLAAAAAVVGGLGVAGRPQSSKYEFSSKHEIEPGRGSYGSGRKVNVGGRFGFTSQTDRVLDRNGRQTDTNVVRLGPAVHRNTTVSQYHPYDDGPARDISTRTEANLKGLRKPLIHLDHFVDHENSRSRSTTGTRRVGQKNMRFYDKKSEKGNLVGEERRVGPPADNRIHVTTPRQDRRVVRDAERLLRGDGGRRRLRPKGRRFKKIDVYGRQWIEPDFVEKRRMSAKARRRAKLAATAAVVGGLGVAGRPQKSTYEFSSKHGGDKSGIKRNIGGRFGYTHAQDHEWTRDGLHTKKDSVRLGPIAGEKVKVSRDPKRDGSSTAVSERIKVSVKGFRKPLAFADTNEDHRSGRVSTTAGWRRPGSKNMKIATGIQHRGEWEAQPEIKLGPPPDHIRVTTPRQDGKVVREAERLLRGDGGRRRLRPKGRRFKKIDVYDPYFDVTVASIEKRLSAAQARRRRKNMATAVLLAGGAAAGLGSGPARRRVGPAAGRAKGRAQEKLAVLEASRYTRQAAKRPKG